MATPQKSCSVMDCNSPTVARGLCSKHYQRWRKSGDEVFTKRAPNGDPKAFLDRLIEHKGDECLIWPYNRGGGGYPIVRINGVKVYAHRIVCEAVHGAAPIDQKETLHSCGNGHLGCINPHHLRWGSHPENMSDKTIHGTAPRKLTESEVRSIRALRGKMPQHQIGALFGVSKGTVWKIQLRKKWAWLT